MSNEAIFPVQKEKIDFNQLAWELPHRVHNLLYILKSKTLSSKQFVLRCKEWSRKGTSEAREQSQPHVRLLQCSNIIRAIPTHERVPALLLKSAQHRLLVVWWHARENFDMPDVVPCRCISIDSSLRQEISDTNVGTRSWCVWHDHTFIYVLQPWKQSKTNLFTATIEHQPLHGDWTRR